MRTRRRPFLDVNRWTEYDRITGIASGVLLISLFLPWFQVTVLGITLTASGLQSHGFMYITLIICAAILGYLALCASPMRYVLPGRTHEWVLLLAGAANLVLVVIAFIATPGATGSGAVLNSGWGPLMGYGYGSFIGGIAALVAVIPLGRAMHNATAR